MSKPYNVVSDIAQLLELYWDDPVAFGEDMLGFEPDEWQRAVMMDVALYRLTSVRSGQGVGKTGLEASLIIWYLCCRPNCRVVCTAPTKQQLNDVLWAEVAKWLETSMVKNLLKWTKTKVYMIGHEKRWFATARTATKPENMQGFHEDYMLFIVDEASGVADPIMEAIMGTLTGDENKLLMCGNPTRTSGVFYDSHNRDRGRFRTHKVDSRTSNRTSKENIQMLIDKYGAESDVVRVRVYGEFPKAEADAFIALELAEMAAGANIDPTGDVLHLGVDVARFGDDETVIAPRIGMKVFKLKCHNKQDTMVTAGWVIALARDMIRKYSQLRNVEIKVDDSGVGGGVTDRLNEVIREEGLKGWRVTPINNGSKPTHKEEEHYENRGTETWADLRDLLQESFSKHIQGQPVSLELPNDERLVTQLTQRKYRMTSKGKIALERKEDMKKRGLDSPDRADAVVLAFAQPERGGVFFPNQR
ncbi:terminase B [Paenibacillus pinisoli]|uniref:Terminase B n=1 Tax=Paenibacillus pinisoli TaxID=1276110 RepID=A0A3A6Q4U3_9BACL|nr:DEAD/DEAH box helicase family protein [Paenibacillus pinisoli]RJX40884.1 terminase B [Paenibacillus pinisoli]